MIGNRIRARLVLTGVMAFTGAAAADTPKVYAAWSQITGSAFYSGQVPPSGIMELNLSMRVVIDDGTGTSACPDFAVLAAQGGQSTVLPVTWTKRHSTPDATGSPVLPVTVCQAPMKNGWDQATLVESVNAPAAVVLDGGISPVVFAGATGVGGFGPPSFVALGDTGCRGLDNARGAQNCDGKPHTDVASFRFQEVANRALDTKPDFVVHLGDYRYDKEYSNSGPERWALWQSDFFDRVRLGLLGARPWAIVRGNHEECSLAGQSWFFFFGVHGPNDSCQGQFGSPLAPAWYFDVADRQAGNADPHRFVVLDTSPPFHRGGSAATADQTQFERALGWATADNWTPGIKPSSWFLMHKPLFAADAHPHPPEQGDHSTGRVFRNAVEALQLNGCKADYQGSVCGLKAVLAAHLHVFLNVVPQASALPHQIVVGMSGVRLDAAVHPTNCTIELDGLGLTEGQVTGTMANVRGRVGHVDNGAFGFARFVRDAGTGQVGWDGTVHYLDDRTRAGHKIVTVATSSSGACKS